MSKKKKKGVKCNVGKNKGKKLTEIIEYEGTLENKFCLIILDEEAYFFEFEE